jgi:hypothetical protein
MRSLKNIKRNYRRAKTDTKEYAWPAPFPQHGFLFLKTFIHRWEVFWSFFWPTFVFFFSVWCYSFDSNVNEEVHARVKII